MGEGAWVELRDGALVTVKRVKRWVSSITPRETATTRNTTSKMRSFT
ncbi:MAG: hypothetical protein MjAS7_1895 [Metallosphaera javensis (ex Sakai et al. 2022)]|nr:MAG: hypothetical protein MjAS7_1895 [Metallosphaera javensis (ex Sakai et al. 2022)]